jgi:hypothetical protein
MAPHHANAIRRRLSDLQRHLYRLSAASIGQEECMSLYREHKGIDIAVHAHEHGRGRWIPHVVLTEPTVGSTRDLPQSPNPESFDNEEAALQAGLNYAIETIEKHVYSTPLPQHG